MLIKYEVNEEHINQMLLWKIAWLRLRISVKLKNSPTVYVVTARGFGDDKLIVEAHDKRQFSVKISDIERINVPGNARA